MVRGGEWGVGGGGGEVAGVETGMERRVEGGGWEEAFRRNPRHDSVYEPT